MTPALLPQDGALLGPGDQARQPGGAHQVGGPLPRRRGAGHGRAGAHAARARLRPGRQPARLWPARPAGGPQHATGAT